RLGRNPASTRSRPQGRWCGVGRLASDRLRRRARSRVRSVVLAARRVRSGYQRARDRRTHDQCARARASEAIWIAFRLVRARRGGIVMARILMVAYTNYRRDPRVRREAEALVEAGH